MVVMVLDVMGMKARMLLDNGWMIYGNVSPFSSGVVSV